MNSKKTISIFSICFVAVTIFSLIGFTPDDSQAKNKFEVLVVEDLAYNDFSDSDLSGQDLSGKKFSNSDFKNSLNFGTNFRLSDLKNTSFYDILMQKRMQP